MNGPANSDEIKLISDCIHKLLSDDSPLKWLSETFHTLTQDCYSAFDEATANSAFHKRSISRNLFALIEGTVFCWKRLILHVAVDYKISLDEGEEVVLSESTATLNNDGDVRIQGTRLGTIPNVKYTLTKASLIFTNSPVDFSGNGWNQLQKTLKIRDRMVHPKSPRDLELSPEDLRACYEAFVWYMKQMLRLLQGAWDFLQEQNQINLPKTERAG